MPTVNIIGKPYTNTRSTQEDPQRCINWFAETGGEGSKQKVVLYPTPGLQDLLLTDANNNSVRQLFEFNGYLYIVAGFKFYRYDGTTLTLKGTLNSVESVYPPIMVSNGAQICIVDNGFGYTYSIAGDSFSEITDPNFTAAAPNYITFQDGYGIYNQPGTAVWWITGINDFSTTGDLDFASANTTNEPIQAIISNRQQIYIFTTVGVEIWFNSGTADFPFERKNTSYITQGTAASGSITLIDNTIYYLTRSIQGEGYVVQIQGDSSPVVVSTPGINRIINQMETIDDAIGFSYQQDGHLFYVLTFPTADKTLVYDLSEQAWHERTTTIVNDPGGGSRQGRWRPNCYAFFGSTHVVGDFESGELMTIETDVYTDRTASIIREFITPVLWQDLKRLSVRSVTLDFQAGTGDSTDSDPQINFYLSKDGGMTYGNAHIASVGDSGQYTQRVKFNRLGMSRAFVGKLTTSSKANVTLLGASIDVEPSDS